MQAAGGGTCHGDAPALADAGGAYGERATGARNMCSTQPSFLLTSQLTYSEVKLTDSLLPTCCVCHGTQRLGSVVVPRTGQSYLVRHISLLICPSGRWLAGNKQGLAACAGPRPWSRQFHNLVFAPGRATIRKAGRPGKRDPGGKACKRQRPSRPAPLFCGSRTGWPLSDSRVYGEGERGIGPGTLLTLYYCSSSSTVLLEAGFSPVSRDASNATPLGGLSSARGRNMTAPPQERHNTGSLTAGDADGAPITRSNANTEMREIQEERTRRTKALPQGGGSSQTPLRAPGMPVDVCVASVSLRHARAFLLFSLSLFFSSPIPRVLDFCPRFHSHCTSYKPVLKKLNSQSLPPLAGRFLKSFFNQLLHPYCLAPCHSLLPFPAFH
ncbi:hypothetical protein HDV63DRAFT_199231 [Trichoderma sp. SZMC 28014]